MRRLLAATWCTFRCHGLVHIPTLTYRPNCRICRRAETQPTTPRARECETGDNAEEIR